VTDHKVNYSDCVPFMGSNAQGTSNGPPGLRGYGIGMGAPTPDDPHNYDEDCLGLNIWTKPQTGEKSKAVLMWIYGGGELNHDSCSFKSLIS
jgi:hypothetical protein